MKAGTSAFDKAWKSEASKNPDKFKSAQHNYIANNHYKPAVNSFKSATGLNADNYSVALQNVIWSVGVQHGAGGAKTLFKNAGIKSNMSEAQIINAIYNERSKVDKYFSGSPSDIKASVKNRFVSERKQALSMLG